MDTTDLNAFSPARMWRDWIVKSEVQWSEAVSQLLKDPRAGGALNRQLDEMQLMQRQFSELAQASLAAANLPSRSDFEALDERMGRLEDGLAQVAAALSQLSQALAASAAVSAAVAPVLARPSRTRRPSATAPTAEVSAQQAATAAVPARRAPKAAAPAPRASKPASPSRRRKG